MLDTRNNVTNFPHVASFTAVLLPGGVLLSGGVLLPGEFCYLGSCTRSHWQKKIKGVSVDDFLNGLSFLITECFFTGPPLKGLSMENLG